MSLDVMGQMKKREREVTKRGHEISVIKHDHLALSKGLKSRLKEKIRPELECGVLV